VRAQEEFRDSGARCACARRVSRFWCSLCVRKKSFEILGCVAAVDDIVGI